ncbi:MAG: hypothetical protein QOG07_2261 [Pseudonocardiales bacterium]|nr:hypothetical protein [Pseudonocardiales bacterium]
MMGRGGFGGKRPYLVSNRTPHVERVGVQPQMIDAHDNQRGKVGVALWSRRVITAVASIWTARIGHAMSRLSQAASLSA